MLALFLAWWLGGVSCATLIMVVQKRPKAIGWSGVIISGLLWPATPFATVYMKNQP